MSAINYLTVTDVGRGRLFATLTVYAEDSDERLHKKAGKVYTKDGVRWCIATTNVTITEGTALMIVRDYHQRYVAGELKGTR